MFQNIVHFIVQRQFADVELEYCLLPPTPQAVAATVTDSDPLQWTAQRVPASWSQQLWLARGSESPAGPGPGTELS